MRDSKLVESFLSYCMTNTLVMKFGGAAVATAEQFSHIADLIIARKSEFSRIVVVTSAMAKATDQLIELAKKIHPSPPQREYDMLISSGERISMSLLAMALCCKGQEAVSFTGSQSGIITCAQHANAKIIDVKPYRIEASLNAGKIVIVAGFQGVSLHKEITTLGRGGSDTSAVALGVALRAIKIEFFKDVLGIYDRDPKESSEAIYYTHLNYENALQIVQKGAKILHDRSIRLASNNGMPLHIRSFNESFHAGTMIEDINRKREFNPVYEDSIIG
jgi:aspartate kinase